MSWNGERLKLVGDKNNHVTVIDGRTEERKKKVFQKRRGGGVSTRRKPPLGHIPASMHRVEVVPGVRW